VAAAASTRFHNGIATNSFNPTIFKNPAWTYLDWILLIIVVLAVLLLIFVVSINRD